MDYPPHDFKIHTKIFMSKKITKILYVLPLYIGVFLLYLVWEFSNSFADNFEFPYYCREGLAVVGKVIE